MNASCPGPDLLLMLGEGVLDEGDGADDVQAHVDGCETCQAHAAKLASALERKPAPFTAADMLEDIQARIEAELVGKDAPSFPPADPALDGVHLLCTFCKDQLAEPIYCGKCLAPYHGDCFAEHGRCAVAGCEGREVVRRAAMPVRPRRRGPLWIGLAFVGAAAAVAAARADWTSQPVQEPSSQPSEEPAEELPGRASEEPAEELPAAWTPYEPAVYAVGDILVFPPRPKWVAQYQGALRSRTVTLNFPETPLSEVVSFLQDITGLNVTLSREIDAEEETVTLRLRAVRLADAVQIICDQAGLQAFLRNETLVFELAGEAVPDDAFSLEPFDDGRVEGDALLASVRTAVRNALGETAWTEPARLELRGSTLEVVQNSAGHSVVRSHVAAMRSSWLRNLEGAWFYPAPPEASSRQPSAVDRGLEAPISLSYEQIPFSEVLADLRARTSISIRITPVARRLCERDETEVALRLKNISVLNALRLCVASNERLVGEADRLGFLIRTRDEPSLEERLERMARRRLQPESVALLEQLQRTAPEFSFEASPLAEVLEYLRDVLELNVVCDASVGPNTLVTTTSTGQLSLEDVLRDLLRSGGLGFQVSQGAIRIAAVGETPSNRSSDPFPTAFDRTLWGEGIATFADQLEVHLGIPVFLTERARTCRARLAIPVGTKPYEALELAALQASLTYGRVAVEGTTFLAVGLSGPEVLLAAIRAVGSQTPWFDAPPTAAAGLTDSRRALREALGELAQRSPLDRDSSTLREELVRVGELRSAVEDTVACHVALAGIEGERAGLDSLLREYQALLARGWSGSSAGLIKLQRRLVDGHRMPSVTDALEAQRDALAAGRSWAQVFPEGYRRWVNERSSVSSPGTYRGLRRLRRLGVVVGSSVEITRARREGLSVRCGFQVGDRLVAVEGVPVSTPAHLVEQLGRARSSLVVVEVQRGGERWSFPVPLSPRSRRLRATLPFGLDLGPESVTVVPAAAAQGLERGDQLLAVAGVAVGTDADLAEDVAACFEPGVKVKVRVRRGGDEVEVEVTLDAPPKRKEKRAAPPAPKVQADAKLPWLKALARRRTTDLAREGGSQGTEAAVEAALRWLKAHQSRDGSWDSDGWTKACRSHQTPCGGAGQNLGDKRYDVGLTSLAILAYLGRGETHRTEGEFKQTLGKALDWLVAQQKKDGTLGFTRGETIYNHAFATWALCEAYGLSEDSRLRPAAERAVNFCLQAQNPNLGWKYGVRTGRNDTSVTGLMTRALIAARRAGIRVPEQAFGGAQRWLKRVTNAAGEVGYETPGGGSSFLAMNDGKFDPVPSMNAVAQTVLIGLGVRRSNDAVRKSARILSGSRPRWQKGNARTVNFYYWFWGTYAMFETGGSKWKAWNLALQKALLPHQRVGGHADGSWDPVGEWCVSGGRVYATAINALTLQAYYRDQRSVGPPLSYDPGKKD